MRPKMKTLWIFGILALLMFGCLQDFQDMGPFMKHTTKLCNSTRTIHPGFNISASNGTINIHQEQYYVCCANIGLGWNLDGKTITIYEDNIGDMCKCTCPLELDIEVWRAEGYERVEIYGIRYKQVQHFELLFNESIPWR